MEEEQEKEQHKDQTERKFTFSYHPPESKKSYAELANELVEDTIRKVVSKNRDKTL